MQVPRFHSMCVSTQWSSQPFTAPSRAIAKFRFTQGSMAGVLDSEIPFTERDIEGSLGMPKDLVIETLEGPDVKSGNSDPVRRILEE